MGHHHATISGVKTPAAIAVATMAAIILGGIVLAQSDERGNTIIVENFKYPEYDEDGRVEFILHGRRAQRAGVRTTIADARLEWVEELPGKPGTRRKLRVIGTVTTPAAVYEETTGIISGDREIHYRSVAMDAEGVGFDADQKRQTLHLRSQVRVVLRNVAPTENPPSPATPRDDSDKSAPPPASKEQKND